MESDMHMYIYQALTPATNHYPQCILHPSLAISEVGKDIESLGKQQNNVVLLDFNKNWENYIETGPQH